ncbi:MAG: aldehyde dehydrogenase family protein [Kangiellaceae bacterium]|nr:aldehyde dehydrogenase family protein [Kangiellaceae bacterium]
MNTLPDIKRNFINGQWTHETGATFFEVIQPSNLNVNGEMILSSVDSVDKAVDAAKRAFPIYSQFNVEARLAIFDQLIELYQNSLEQMAYAISMEMGAPITMSRNMQATVGLGLLKSTRDSLVNFVFEKMSGATQICKEPVGVSVMITPWNWPMNQVVSKVAAALAAGCTMILKPSEYSPYSAALFTQLISQLDLPKGTFNLVFGDAIAGAALSAHPDVDVVSITGSTRAGVAVAKAAAPTVKRVTQELGGKSPFVILPGADLNAAVKSCVQRLLVNTGQSCNAPTRLLVAESDLDSALTMIQTEIDAHKVGDSFDEKTDIGPVVNKIQFEKINAYIQKGIDEGAKVFCGGTTKIAIDNPGYYVKPTVFYDVDERSKIVREEIFGPVVCVLTYEDKDDALRIANDTEYGLAAYVFGKDKHTALEFSKGIRAGMIHINGATAEMQAPFGGYKQSGNGRERGESGMEEYLETKSVYLG